MIRRLLLLLSLVSVVLFAASGVSTEIVWQDEFDGPQGAAPDRAKWVYDLGASGWGNKELQNYTDKRENSFLDGKGKLVIRAVKGPDGGYTSARLKTLGRFDVKYGRIEARIRIPRGQGIWPAFWMLGANIEKADWPRCGEIDIMENIGKEPDIVHGTLHGPGFSGASSISSDYKHPAGERFADDFHIYATEWREDAISFFVDGKRYSTVRKAELPAGGDWVFDQPFFILLNLAVGGLWPGYPDQSTDFPQAMIVDYVRVYK